MKKIFKSISQEPEHILADDILNFIHKKVHNNSELDQLTVVTASLCVLEKIVAIVDCDEEKLLDLLKNSFVKNVRDMRQKK